MTETSHDVTVDDTQTGQLTADEYFRVLADERRRALVDVLRDRTEPLSVADLAAAVRPRSDGGLPTDDEHFRITLHHTHLPLLDDVGIVDYDVEAKMVRPNQSALRQV